MPNRVSDTCRIYVFVNATIVFFSKPFSSYKETFIHLTVLLASNVVPMMCMTLRVDASVLVSFGLLLH